MTRLIFTVGYVACGLAMATLVAISHRRSAAIATFTELIDGALRDPAARLTLLVFWWWLGWHFLVTPPLPPA